MLSIPEKLSFLRKEMQKHQIAAYIIPGTDPHLSEYLPGYWQEREFISGFTGSAGKVVVSQSKAGLWTDSRYFLQAEEQLKGSGIELMKMGVEGTPTINQWLINELKSNDRVGINPLLIAARAFEADQNTLIEKDLQFVAAPDLIFPIWKNRPPLPNDQVRLLKDSITGESTQSKIARLREEMQSLGADYYMVSALDEIAWLLNMRGNDISYNPVSIAYVLVGKEKTTLFINLEKVSDDLRKVSNLKCEEITDILHHLNNLPAGSKIALDQDRLNYLIYEQLAKHAQIIQTTSWPILQKSTKNNTEIAGFRKAMEIDGVALVQFFIWLEEALKNNQALTEYSIAQKLRTFRAAQNGFVDESFSTIAGYNGNGAIVHYSAPKEGCATLDASGILLLDSGGQYEMGTTDITRTVALGSFPKQAKDDYTNVLKGHLALSNISFPQNTRGAQLDVLARQFLWNTNLDYGHGTGHGVGHFLNVHEGPQGIRKEENPVPLQKGMVISNEPGLYRANQYGIRIENLITVREKEENEFGKFFDFETLTLFPYEQSLMNESLLSKNEIELINTYHSEVYERLSPYLDNNEKLWLKQKTKAIQQR